MFITNNTPLKEIRANYLSIDPSIPPDDYYRIIKGAEWRLYNRHLYPAIYDDKIVFLGDSSKIHEKIEVKGYNFYLSDDTFILNSMEHNYPLSNMVNMVLKRKAFSLGYEQSDSQKFFHRVHYKKDFFTFHDAYYSDVEVFNDGRVGIWIDPTTKWKFALDSFLSWAKKTHYKGVDKYLVGRKVKCPSVAKNSMFSAKIKSIEDIPINQFEINIENGKKTTVYDFWNESEKHRIWLQRNQIQLNPSEMPTLLIDIPNLNNPLPYPPSVIEIVIDLLDPIIPANVFQEKKSLTPENRIKETIRLFDKLLGNGLTLNGKKLNFRRKLFNWNNISFDYGKIISLPPPSLIFGNGNICSPPNAKTDPDIKTAMFNYGPSTIKKSIKISYIGPESEVNNFSKFHKYLNIHAKKLKLGEFVLNNIYPIDRIHHDRYMRVCNSIKSESEDLVIVILPTTKPTKTYYAAKRGLGKNLVISEMIQWKTYTDLLKRSNQEKLLSFPNYNIALKAYGRALKTGESIWHLNNPAGGLNPKKIIYFMGFDVSRNPETRKEAAAYAAVCDIYGRILYKNVIDSHRGEKVQAEVLSDWFFDLAISTYDDVGEQNKIDCLFLFKDGPIYASQIKEYQQGAIRAKERLLNEHIMSKSSDIKIVAVIKRGLHRFYGTQESNYRVQYSGVIRDVNNSIIITSKPRIGTSSSTRLNFTYQMNNDIDIEQISRIFNDLRYLDWSSLFQQPKTILPLHIVQNLAKLSKEDIYVPYDPR